jgi:SAM-dependent methyltransferase
MGDGKPLGWAEMFEDRILSLDSLHVFFSSALLLAAQSTVVAEVGCGRGWQVSFDEPQGPWQDLRGPGRTVIGIDIDTAAADNPVLDEFRLIEPDGSWPLQTGSVDLAVCDYVLEHVADPVERRLPRAMQSALVICARKRA